MNIAIYPGTFDPFTKGHLDICARASVLFDKVHIIIAKNANKQRVYDSEAMKNAIEKDLSSIGKTNCYVHIYDGLVALFAKELGARYIIRGIRNNIDYNYEENVAEVNKVVNSDIECIYFRANNISISSSMVKELYHYGQDISKYVPPSILDTMCNYKSNKQ